MSFVVMKNQPEEQIVETSVEKSTSKQSSGLSMKIDVVPIPVSSEQVNLELKGIQNSAIQQIIRELLRQLRYY